MNAKDWIEFIKAWDEYKKSDKPKEEKKPDNKSKFDTMDYFVFTVAYMSIAWIVGTCFVLSYLTTFIKALH